MKERMEKAGGMENYEKVVQLFTPGRCPSSRVQKQNQGQTTFLG